jgi:hypothetical protein
MAPYRSYEHSGNCGSETPHNIMTTLHKNLFNIRDK